MATQKRVAMPPMTEALPDCQSDFPSLYPSQIPAIPPTNENNMPDMDKALPPHKSGTKFPAVAPTIKPHQPHVQIKRHRTEPVQAVHRLDRIILPADALNLQALRPQHPGLVIQNLPVVDIIHWLAFPKSLNGPLQLQQTDPQGRHLPLHLRVARQLGPLLPRTAPHASFRRGIAMPVERLPQVEELKRPLVHRVVHGTDLPLEIEEGVILELSAVEPPAGLMSWHFELRRPGRKAGAQPSLAQEVRGAGPVFHQIYWNGRKNYFGEILPSGRYECLLSATDMKNHTRTKHEWITLAGAPSEEPLLASAKPAKRSSLRSGPPPSELGRAVALKNLVGSLM